MEISDDDLCHIGGRTGQPHFGKAAVLLISRKGRVKIHLQHIPLRTDFIADCFRCTVSAVAMAERGYGRSHYSGAAGESLVLDALFISSDPYCP